MPKKFSGENTKAVVARNRRADKLAEEKAIKEKEVEDAYWRDDDRHVNKKIQRKEDKERKRQDDLQRKAENRALAEQEDKDNTPMIQLPSQKITVFQLQTQRETAKLETDANHHKKQNNVLTNEPLVENLNREIDDVVSGSGIDAALAAMNSKDDKPQVGSMAAAFKSFEEKRLIQVKKEHPTLRLSQLKQRIRKEWQKSPENPINQRTLAES